MSTGSISLDILLNKILTDAISGGNESIRAIQKRYPSLFLKKKLMKFLLWFQRLPKVTLIALN